MKMNKLYLLLVGGSVLSASLTAQVQERTKPAEWEQLVKGGRYMDRFEAMPEGKLSEKTWGADDVRPRYVENGIEHPDISFWGGISYRHRIKYTICLCVDGLSVRLKDIWNGLILPFTMLSANN